jgi:ubiquinone/menaquinone biosynthesis C-methylase UbiE
MSAALRLALLLMRLGNKHSRFGAHVCNTPEFIELLDGQISTATRRAFDDGYGFFQRFDGTLSVHDLTAKDVLDIGSGCGGRTVYYLLHGNPESIVGLDISMHRARIAHRSVQNLCGDSRICFVVGLGEVLPFEDSSFDFVISYDVFEHVKNLHHVLDECHRVLRPGGCLSALFPPYYGPRAHHLDFITTLPFLHYVFSPRVLVQAANQILQEQPSLRDSPLPKPERSYLGREVLPRLNGTTERDFRRIVNNLPFEVEHMALVPFGAGGGGLAKRIVSMTCGALLRLPVPFHRDVLISTIRCVLRKPETVRANEALHKEQTTPSRRFHG